MKRTNEEWVSFINKVFERGLRGEALHCAIARAIQRETLEEIVALLRTKAENFATGHDDPDACAYYALRNLANDIEEGL